MRSWIEECRNGHENETGSRSEICWRNGTSVSTGPALPCPRRLVYVGRSQGDDSDIPRLIETNGQKIRYAALSYCWGKGEWLQTRKNTLWERKSGILWDVLPRCHFDACVATRLLGLDYVWIDALCIVQNDADDWNHEAAIMGQIYQAAYVTICAVKSSSSNEGFLDRRVLPVHAGQRSWKQDLDRSRKLAAAIPYHNSAKGISGCYFIRYLSLHAKSQPSATRDFGHFSAEVEASTWNTRGWTLQERQLSSRTIFFGAGAIFFECQAFCRSEAFPALSRRTTPWQDITLLLGDDRQAIKVFLRSVWTNIAMLLCNRKFTYRKDILPAMAALWTRFSREMQLAFVDDVQVSQASVRCIAGLWDVCLLEDLLWICQGWNSKFYAARSEDVPTWSWLSLQTSWRVAGDWIPHGDNSHIFKIQPGYEVLDIHNPNGPCLVPTCVITRTPKAVPSEDGDSSLWLHGFITQQKLSCRQKDMANDWTSFSVNGISVEIAFDSDWRPKRQAGKPMVTDPDRVINMSLYLAVVFRRVSNPDDTWEYERRTSVPANRIYGLVLNANPGSGSGEQLHKLDRVGVFRADDEEETKKRGQSTNLPFEEILGAQLNLSEREFHVW